MWEQDYGLSSAGKNPDLDLLSDTDAFDIDGLTEETILPCAEPEGEVFWRAHVEYANHTIQDIICYEDSLPDKPEELYDALVDYFITEDEEL